MTETNTLKPLGSTAGLDLRSVVCETFPVTSSRYQQWAAVIKGVSGVVVYAKYDCSSKHHAASTIKGVMANMKSNAAVTGAPTTATTTGENE